jgi:4-hydroxy-2-oxoheptanedioate aldolase
MPGSLKTRIGAGEQLLGVLLRVPAEELVEMVALSGFDFLFLDCEHGPADVVEVRRHIVLAALHGVPSLVRVGSGETGLALRVLDAGAAGVVGPHIDTPAGARALVDSVHYPPLGHRGFATYSRAGRFGSVEPETHRTNALADTVVVAMIESPEGVRHAADIAAVPGVDAVMIGIADLRAALTADDPPFDDAVRQVNRALEAGAAARLDIVPGREAAAAAFADGAQLVVYNLTHALMAHFTELSRVHGRRRPVAPVATDDHSSR